jgi:hypothetical protein
LCIKVFLIKIFDGLCNKKIPAVFNRSCRVAGIYRPGFKVPGCQAGSAQYTAFFTMYAWQHYGFCSNPNIRFHYYFFFDVRKGPAVIVMGGAANKCVLRYYGMVAQPAAAGVIDLCPGAYGHRFTCLQQPGRPYFAGWINEIVGAYFSAKQPKEPDAPFMHRVRRPFTENSPNGAPAIPPQLISKRKNRA